MFTNMEMEFGMLGKYFGLVKKYNTKVQFGT
jgi:hypothetical protein